MRRALLALLVPACSWPSAGPGCRPETEPAALPEALQESSGVAVSRRHPGLYWTVNDSGEPLLYAVDAGGTLRAEHRLRTPTPVKDWEDMAAGPCQGRDGGTGESCLYIGDVGDNYLERDTLLVHRLAEPDTVAAGPVEVETFSVRLPDGPRNVETLFVLPGERLFLVTKGTEHAVALYRHPGPLRADSTVTLEAVAELTDGPRILPRQVTGGGASADGRVVALRTYEELVFHAVRGDRLVPLDGGRVSLRTLQEGQGEAVALGAEGEVVLTSEAGPLRARGSLVVLRCTPPDPEPS